jgi:hypothetical protein
MCLAGIFDVSCSAIRLHSKRSGASYLADMWRASYFDFTQLCVFAHVESYHRPVQVVCCGCWQAPKAPLTLGNMSALLPSHLSYKEPSCSKQQRPVTATPLVSAQRSQHLQKSLDPARRPSSTFVMIDQPKKLGRRSPRSGNT